MKKITFLLIFLALLPFIKNADAQDLEADSLALVAIYNAADGPNWTGTDKWLTDSVKNWEGVTVDAITNRVTKLSLNYINFGGNGGTLSPSIGDLTALTLFEINEAPNLTGSIPAELWNCTNIGRLQIKQTGLTGGIPAGIASMVNAYELNFQGTKLGGEIPAEIYELPSLTKPYLHESDFTGTVPSTLTGATGLKRVYVQSNKLVGPLPFVALTDPSSAKINLTGNFFTYNDVKRYHDSATSKANYYAGFTDDFQYAKETTIEEVELGATHQLDGTVTDAEAYAWFKDEETTPLANSATLSITDFSMDDEGTYVCKAQSSLVANFDIRTVYELSLDGLVHDSLALVAIYEAADGANWTGTVKWLTDSVKNWEGVTVDPVTNRVTKLSLNYMNFGGNGGTLSPMIGKLTALTLFEINEAPNLTGSIPAELWNCTNIGRLQIKQTGLTGGIPAGIESMVNAYELNFQGTKLGGEIPAEIYELPSLTKPYLHESDFTGTVPSTLTGATGLKRVYVQSNKLVGPLPFVALTDPSSAKINLTGNFFTFNDVKQYHDSAASKANYYAGFTDDFQYAQEAKTFNLNEGDSIAFELYVENGESYAWFYNDGTTPISADTLFALPSVLPTDTGTYVCKVQSSLIANFDIRAIFTVENVVATIPALTTAASSEDGTTVTLTFDISMDDASGLATDFTFKQDATTINVSSVAISGNTVVLTLESAITSSTATLTVSYAPGTLKGATGGLVAAFNDQAVTNNTLVSGLNEVELTVNIYPNPFTNVINVSSESIIESVEISDISGKLLIQQSVADNSVSIPVSNLKQGSYFITIRNSKKLSIQKLIKY